jgi:hypothetical protein
VSRPIRAAHGLLLLLLIGLLAPGAHAQPPANPGTADGCRVVADYGDAAVGEFPGGWQPRDEAARSTYRVVAESGIRFVRGTAEGTGSQMGREFPWDASRDPVLTWRWRPRVFPQGSDERDPARNDSPLAVYAVFGRTQVLGRAVKYVWSRVVPAGTTLPTGQARVIVLRSGQPPDAEWVTETVNVRRDYERLYGEAPGRARGIAVLTDSDQTRSRAVGDYGSFSVCPERR